MAVLSHLAKQKNSFLTAEPKINDSAGEYGLHGMLTPYLLSIEYKQAAHYWTACIFWFEN